MQVRLYVLAIAFSLAFGALFSKTWRVHKIFTAQRALKKQVIGIIHPYADLGNFLYNHKPLS
jgi:hypothetical protein